MDKLTEMQIERRTAMKIGWGLVAWVAMLFLMFYLFGAFNTTKAQVVISIPEYTHESAAAPTVYDIGDSSFIYNKWNSDPSTWWSNTITFYPSGSGDYIAYDGVGTELLYNHSTYQINISWEHVGMTGKNLTVEIGIAYGTNVWMRVKLGDGTYFYNVSTTSWDNNYGVYSAGINTLDFTCPYDTVNRFDIAFTTSDSCAIDYIKLYDQ